MAAAFSTMKISLSFDMLPLRFADTDPHKARQDACENIVSPEIVVRSSPNFSSNMAGLNVPKAAQNRRATAIPSSIPRYHIVKPKVRPPMTHRIPKLKDHLSEDCGAVAKCLKRSGTSKLAKSNGAMTQLNMPTTIL